MKKKLVWRLSDKPTPKDLRDLVEAEILTKEEAHEILVRDSEQPDENELTAIKKEIELLRELVLQLSKKEPINTTTIIRDYAPLPTRNAWPWFKPYDVWCETQFINGNVSRSDGYTVNGTTTVN